MNAMPTTTEATLNSRPVYVLRMAECLLRMDGVSSARSLLKLVVRHCAERGGHDAVRMRAQAMLDLLANERAAA